MDDLKDFAKTDQHFQDLLNIVKQFSNDIRMELGLDKCAKAAFFLWKASKDQGHYSTYHKRHFLEPEESYKYIWITEGDGIPL